MPERLSNIRVIEQNLSHFPNINFDNSNTTS